MKKQLKDLETFQKAFNSTFNETPTLLENKDYVLRYHLLAEENEEYLEACRNNDKVGILDALTDQLYIVLGTIVSHGMQHIIEDAFQEVQNSKDRKSTRLNSSHVKISYAVFCLKKKKKTKKYNE